MTRPGRLLSIITCGAGPASEVGTLVKLAQQRGWRVQVIATPAGLAFLDIARIEALTGSPCAVLTVHRGSLGQRRQTR